MESVDTGHNKQINYTEFLAAALDIKASIREDEGAVKAIF